MNTESDFLPDKDLLVCPFMNQCILPKHQFLCKVPECKKCPDYESFLR